MYSYYVFNCNKSIHELVTMLVLQLNILNHYLNK